MVLGSCLAVNEVVVKVLAKAVVKLRLKAEAVKVEASVGLSKVCNGLANAMLVVFVDSSSIHALVRYL